MNPSLCSLLSDVKEGHRSSEAEALVLFKIQNRDIWDIAAAADEKREHVVGNAVTYVRNQNINVTNLCVNSCGFCGFSKKPGDEGIYFHNRDTIQKKGGARKNPGGFPRFAPSAGFTGFYRPIVY